jgi:hypothetical protein
MKHSIALAAIATACLVLPAAAQQSPSFRLDEHVFNEGGHPASGTVLTSASFTISLDAIGEAATGTGLSSASFRMDGSFGAAYPPPGEVTGLRLTDHQTLVWDPERSVGVYHLYRDLLSGLAGLGYGTCHEQDIPGETATDADTPPTGNGYFYLVTAENRLDEEGTKGSDGDSNPRGNPSPCP